MSLKEKCTEIKMQVSLYKFVGLCLVACIFEGQISPISAVKVDCLVPLQGKDSPYVNCSVEIGNETNPGKYSSKCIKDDLLQIIGEYGELYIRCSAPFALDFDYDGFQPTEAIGLKFSKQIESNSTRKLITYELEIKIRSVESLYQFYRKTNAHSDKKKWKNTREEIRRHSYSRSGRYTIRGVFNRTLSRSMYFFLEEDTQEISLMKNKNTLSARRVSEDTFQIPCRPSHMNSTVALLPAKTDAKRTYDPTIGWSINVQELSKVSEYECIINASTGIADARISLNFKIPSDNSSIQFGLEELPVNNVGDNINIDAEVQVLNHEDFSVDFACPVNPDKGHLSVIEAVNPSHSRLLQEFVFPHYANHSYSVEIGIQSSPPGLFVFRGAALSGLVFCTNGVDYKVLEYATGFDRGVRRFRYGTDWSAFDISESPARNHLQIGLYDLPGNSGANHSIFYVNQTYTFKCKVRTHGLVAPVVWYETINNRTVESYIDYKLEDDGYSYFEKEIAENLTEVACAASFWDREIWKNVSLKISPIKGTSPAFVNLQGHNNVHFPVGSKNRIVKCEATGDPVPELKWFNQSGEQVTSSSFGSASLEFPLFSQAHAQNYTCFASNIYGNYSTIFSVGVAKRDSGVDYTILIGIPIVVFLVTITGTFVYVRFLRKEYAAGLTKKEIHEFENGCEDTEAKAMAISKEGGENEYVPQNALLIPYDKAYEVDAEKFQISKTEILGSGAFGIVYRGILNGDPVAVKTVKPNAEKAYLKALLSEIKIMIYLGRHPHLIEMVGASTKDLRKGMIYVFVEMCPLGNLEKYLRKNRDSFLVDSSYSNVPNQNVIDPDSFGLQDLYVWSYQISKGMEYLASKRVIHGDLATRNVLLMGDKTAKITDFGLSRQLYNYASYVKKNEEPLPWRWMAIESLRDLSFSSKSDVWAFGVTLWEIFALAEVPYPGFQWNLDFVQKLEDGLRMGQPKYATPELYKEILLSSWHTDPDGRPTFEQISQRLQDMSRHPLTADLEIVTYTDVKV